MGPFFGPVKCFFFSMEKPSKNSGIRQLRLGPEDSGGFANGNGAGWAFNKN